MGNNNNNNNNNQHHVGQSERNGIEYDGGDSQEDDLLEDGQGKLRRQGKRSSEYRRRTQQPPQGKGQRHLATRKKIMKVENGLDDATEALAASTLAIEEAEKQQLVNEEEVSALQRRCSLLDDDCARSDGRLQVESTKLAEAAADAEAVEIKRKLLEAKNMVNEERIDSLEGQIATASEAEAKIQELEEQLNIVGQNMKTLELSETNAL